MTVEIKGQQLRIRVRTPEGATEFRTQDVGAKGRLQRIAGFYPGLGWRTQSWRINLSDYVSLEYVIATINGLKISSVKKNKAQHLAKKWFKEKEITWFSKMHGLPKSTVREKLRKDGYIIS